MPKRRAAALRPQARHGGGGAVALAILADLELPPRPQHDAFEDALGAAEMYVMPEDMRQRGVRLPGPRSEISGDFSIAWPGPRAGRRQG